MKLSLTVLLGCLLVSGSSLSQTKDGLTPGYYVVVASFTGGQETYAQAYSAKLNEGGRHTAYGFDPLRKFYHVYLDRYTEFNESIQKMLKARSDGFGTSWVRIIKGQPVADIPSALPETKTVTPSPAVKEAPVAIEEKKIVDEKLVTSPEPVVDAPLVPTEKLVAADVPATDNNDPLYHPDLLTKSTVLLTLFNPTNNQQVEGDVEIIDSERAKLLVKAKGNDFIILPDPKSPTGKLSLISSSFGFRPVQHEISYKTTPKDTLQDFIDVVDNHYRITFDMVRLRRGDIAVLYNVYFYNDAAVMLPDSKYELNKLLQMMKDYPGYRIKLHGHTNGNASGKIIMMGETKNFFTLSSDVKQGHGSAKELSRARAQIIKDWLVSNGIADNRIEVQAHGGSRMIHDKNSANAKRNVRVEVEMLSE